MKMQGGGCIAAAPPFALTSVGTRIMVNAFSLCWEYIDMKGIT